MCFFIAQPAIKKYCEAHDRFFKDQMEQTSRSSPKGPKIFTPNMNQLSQSKPIGLPEQRPDTGHAPKAKAIIDINSSTHAKILSIHISNSYT
jgi:hypothetical protein